MKKQGQCSTAPLAHSKHSQCLFFTLFSHRRPTRTAPVSKISTAAAPALPSSAIFLTSLQQLRLQPKLMLHYKRRALHSAQPRAA